jgi:hypothetical protein
VPLLPPLKGPTCLYLTLANKTESVAENDVFSFCAEANNTARNDLFEIGNYNKALKLAVC